MVYKELLLVALSQLLVHWSFKQMSPDMQGIAISFAICGLMSMILTWHRQNFSVPPAEMTQLAVQMLTNPLIRL